MSRLRWVYEGLERSAALALWRRLRPSDIVLCYHNVLPADAEPRGETALHLPLAVFEAQLEWLADRFRVVPLAVLLDRSTGAARPAHPRAAITFDDAYLGVLRHALPALRRRRMPATVFLTTDGSTAPRLFWWDLVAARHPHADRARLRDRFDGRGAAILDALGLSGTEDALPDTYLPADWSALRGAAAGDLEFGAHTASHPMLSRLSAPALRVELHAPRVVIEARLGAPVSFVAYPYGDSSAAVAAAAADAGYAAGFGLSGALLRGAIAPYGVPRLSVPSGMPRAALAAAVSGVRLRPGTP